MVLWLRFTRRDACLTISRAASRRAHELKAD